MRLGLPEDFVDVAIGQTAGSPRIRSLPFPSTAVRPLGWVILRLLSPSILTRCLKATLLAMICILLCSCHAQPGANSVVTPTIEFTDVPLAANGDNVKMTRIEGRVIGAQPGQQIVLYAKAGTAWWVQPFANQPFTKIQSNSKWSSPTHPGTHFAALLVGSDFQPPARVDALPTVGVLALAVTPGKPVFWQRWWFVLLCMSAAAGMIFGIHRLRLRQTTRQLSVRFEERLAERTRVAQELHDTLLQGVISASMQLQVAVDHMPAHSAAEPALRRALQLMGLVVEEGQNTVRGLRSSTGSIRDLEDSFSKFFQDLDPRPGLGFRVIVKGHALPLQPIIRSDVYAIGREALLNAFRHSQARNVEVEVEYSASQLLVAVRDDGCGIAPNVIRNGKKGLLGIRNRAERIGAKLKVSTSAVSGTEVELSVPGRLAYESHRSVRASNWLTGLPLRSKESTQTLREKEGG
jgi:signal transduction histidine kinase